jgi:hypothetical protein
MIGPVQTAFRTAMAPLVGDWPIRWPNEGWAADVLLSDGNLPVELDGAGVQIPRPFVEAEVIGGSDRLFAAGASTDGKRTSHLPGLLRVYLCVPQGSGMTGVTTKSDAIKAALKRKTLTDDGAGNRLLTEDPRVDDGVAAYEEAGRFVRMLSVPFDYWYRS